MRKFIGILLLVVLFAAPALAGDKVQQGTGFLQNPSSTGKPGSYLFTDNGKVYRVVLWDGSAIAATSLAVGSAVCYQSDTASALDYDVNTPETATLERLAGIIAELPVDSSTGSTPTTINAGDELLIQVRGPLDDVVDLSTTTNATIGYSLKAVNSAYTLAPDTAAGTEPSYKRTVFLRETRTVAGSDSKSNVDVFIDTF